MHSTSQNTTTTFTFTEQHIPHYCHNSILSFKMLRLNLNRFVDMTPLKTDEAHARLLADCGTLSPSKKRVVRAIFC